MPRSFGALIVFCCALLFPIFAAPPGPGYTVAQLTAFMRSSIQTKAADKEVAQYVAHMKLSEKLDASVIEQLQSEGLGPKTVAALKDQMNASSTLSAPAVAQAAPKPAPIPPPPYDEEQKVISDMTEYALNYARRLPDFICTQVTRRYADPRFRGSWINMDTVVAKVSWTDGHENYDVKLVNNTMVENKSLESLNGAISTGEFGSVMESIFKARSAAEFHFERWATLRGKRMYVFNYRIDQSRSDYSIEFDRKVRIVAAYKGLIYVDKAEHKIQRIVAEADEIPAAFPVTAAGSTIDYDIATIGTTSYMLPMRAEVRMRDAEAAIRNNIEFRSYRKFGADTEIKYDAIPDELPDSKSSETPAKPEPPK